MPAATMYFIFVLQILFCGLFFHLSDIFLTLSFYVVVVERVVPFPAGLLLQLLVGVEITSWVRSSFDFRIYTCRSTCVPLKCVPVLPLPSRLYSQFVLSGW